MPAKKVTDFRKYIEDSSIPVTESGCWLWLKACNARGYGVGTLLHKSRHWDAHRLSYTTYHGEIPAGMYVLHKCDVKCCVNPDHLYAGTNQDNADDAVRRNRYFRGKRSKKGETWPSP